MAPRSLLYLFRSGEDPDLFLAGLTDDILAARRRIEERSGGRFRFYRVWQVGEAAARRSLTSLFASLEAGSGRGGDEEPVRLDGGRLERLIGELDDLRRRQRLGEPLPEPPPPPGPAATPATPSPPPRRPPPRRGTPPPHAAAPRRPPPRPRPRRPPADAGPRRRCIDFRPGSLAWNLLAVLLALGIAGYVVGGSLFAWWFSTRGVRRAPLPPLPQRILPPP